MNAPLSSTQTVYVQASANNQKLYPCLYTNEPTPPFVTSQNHRALINPIFIPTSDVRLIELNREVIELHMQLFQDNYSDAKFEVEAVRARR